MFELEQNKAKIQNRPICLIFDGTQKICENFVAIARFVDDAGMIQERLVKLGRYIKSFKENRHNELSSALITLIMFGLGVNPRFVVSLLCDRASVNEKAVNDTPILMVTLSNMIHGPCNSHTLSHTSEQAESRTPAANDFWLKFMATFTHNLATGQSYSRATHQPTPKYSRTRWMAKLDAVEPVSEVFLEMVDWLLNYELEFEDDTETSVSFQKLQLLLLPSKWVDLTAEEQALKTAHVWDIRWELAVLIVMLVEFVIGPATC
jgi:hypothetical protein